MVWNNLTVCTQGSYRTLQKGWFASSFPGESPDRAIDQALWLLVQCREARAQQSLHGGPGSAEGTCKSMLSWAQMVQLSAIWSQRGPWVLLVSFPAARWKEKQEEGLALQVDHKQAGTSA